MKNKKILVLFFFSLLLFGTFISIVRAPIIDNPDRLWTTNAAGLGEVDVFSLGDPVYLKTADTFDSGYPMVLRGTYRVYLFDGNKFTSALGSYEVPDNTLISSIPGLILTIDIETDPDTGRFGLPLVGYVPNVSHGSATPIKIWDANAVGSFTLVLDHIKTVAGDTVGGAGYWDAGDYRDDFCHPNAPPSFTVLQGNVIPEVGTIVIATAMFSSLGLFILVKRKNHNQ